jgi:hypothetical protein
VEALRLMPVLFFAVPIGCLGRTHSAFYRRQKTMDKLNNYPRKCLGMKTPNQVFFGINPVVAQAS